MTTKRFSSRWAMILTCMGMAVGTGNIWRFPREVANNGGGSFLIPWFVFLFLWSVPLLMVELSIGQTTRKGPYGAFSAIMGKRWGWMGGFISVCAMMIMCYYAVVTGWTFKYVIYALDGSLAGIDHRQSISLFDGFRSTWGSWFAFLLALAVAGAVIYRGTRGIERVNKLLIPALILILFLGAVRALLLENSGEGLSYLLHVEPERLADPRHWIAGLTQSAWSTGAGWGLMLTYAVYARDEEDPVTTPMATGFGNNSIEVLVGLMIFPSVFALMGADALALVSGASSKGGIAFQTAPLLFDQMAGGRWLGLLFFLGLAFAALTSLIAMVELSTRFFQDFKLSRRKSLLVSLGLCLVLGTPSALKDGFFDNQDFVWGVGLILSGLFLALFVLSYGAGSFAQDFLFKGEKKRHRWFAIAMGLVVVEGLVLLGWWLVSYWKDFGWQCLTQWGALIAILFVFRHKFLERMAETD